MGGRGIIINLLKQWTRNRARNIQLVKVRFCFLGSEDEDDDDDDDDDRNDFHGVEDFTKKKVLVEKSKPPKTTDVKCFSYTWLLIINVTFIWTCRALPPYSPSSGGFSILLTWASELLRMDETKWHFHSCCKGYMFLQVWSFLWT